MDENDVAQGASISPRKMLRVLIIDDNAVDRELLAVYLRKAWPFELSLTVEMAEDGIAALEKMRQTSFALIVLDWNLPRGGNGQVLREMRKLGVYIPVVVVSGLQKSELSANLDALGAGYLSKDDLNPATLYCAIAESLRRFDSARSRVSEPVPKGPVLFQSHTAAVHRT